MENESESLLANLLALVKTMSPLDAINKFELIFNFIECNPDTSESQLKYLANYYRNLALNHPVVASSLLVPHILNFPQPIPFLEIIPSLFSLSSADLVAEIVHNCLLLLESDAKYTIPVIAALLDLPIPAILLNEVSSVGISAISVVEEFDVPVLYKLLLKNLPHDSIENSSKLLHELRFLNLHVMCLLVDISCEVIPTSRRVAETIFKSLSAQQNSEGHIFDLAIILIIFNEVPQLRMQIEDYLVTSLRNGRFGFVYLKQIFELQHSNEIWNKLLPSAWNICFWIIDHFPLLEEKFRLDVPSVLFALYESTPQLQECTVSNLLERCFSPKDHSNQLGKYNAFLLPAIGSSVSASVYKVETGAGGDEFDSAWRSLLVLEYYVQRNRDEVAKCILSAISVRLQGAGKLLFPNNFSILHRLIGCIVSATSFSTQLESLLLLSLQKLLSVASEPSILLMRMLLSKFHGTFTVLDILRDDQEVSAVAVAVISIGHLLRRSSNGTRDESFSVVAQWLANLSADARNCAIPFLLDALTSTGDVEGDSSGFQSQELSAAAERLSESLCQDFAFIQRYSASIWEDVEGSIEGRLGITLQLTNEVTSHRFSEFVFWNFDLVSACAEEIMQSVGPLELLPHSAIADSLSSVFWIIFKMSIYFSDNRLTNYFRCSEASKSILIQEMAISAEIETGENKVGEGGRAIASVVSFENINLWSSSFADALLGIANFDHYSEFRIEHVIRAAWERLFMVAVMIGSQTGPSSKPLHQVLSQVNSTRCITDALGSRINLKKSTKKIHRPTENVSLESAKMHVVQLRESLDQVTSYVRFSKVTNELYKIVSQTPSLAAHELCSDFGINLVSMFVGREVFDVCVKKDPSSRFVKGTCNSLKPFCFFQRNLISADPVDYSLVEQIVVSLVNLIPALVQRSEQLRCRRGDTVELSSAIRSGNEFGHSADFNGVALLLVFINVLIDQLCRAIRSNCQQTNCSYKSHLFWQALTVCFSGYCARHQLSPRPRSHCILILFDILQQQLEQTSDTNIAISALSTLSNLCSRTFLSRHLRGLSWRLANIIFPSASQLPWNRLEINGINILNRIIQQKLSPQVIIDDLLDSIPQHPLSKAGISFIKTSLIYQIYSIQPQIRSSWYFWLFWWQRERLPNRIYGIATLADKLIVSLTDSNASQSRIKKVIGRKRSACEDNRRESETEAHRELNTLSFFNELYTKEYFVLFSTLLPSLFLQFSPQPTGNGSPYASLIDLCEIHGHLFGKLIIALKHNHLALDLSLVNQAIKCCITLLPSVLFAVEVSMAWRNSSTQACVFADSLSDYGALAGVADLFSRSMAVVDVCVLFGETVKYGYSQASAGVRSVKLFNSLSRLKIESERILLRFKLLGQKNSIDSTSSPRPQSQSREWLTLLTVANTELDQLFKRCAAPIVCDTEDLSVETETETETETFKSRMQTEPSQAAASEDEMSEYTEESDAEGFSEFAAITSHAGSSEGWGLYDD